MVLRVLTKKFNKIILIFLFFVMVNLSLLYCQDFNLNLPKINRKIVVLIQTENLKNNVVEYTPIGTGFWFASDTWNYVITAKHVLIDPNTTKFRYNKVRLLFYVEGYKEEIPELILGIPGTRYLINPPRPPE